MLPARLCEVIFVDESRKARIGDDTRYLSVVFLNLYEADVVCVAGGRVAAQPYG